MSNIRRSRPEEQDSSLKRLQELSATHQDLALQGQTSLTNPQRTHKLSEQENYSESGIGDDPPVQGSSKGFVSPMFKVSNIPSTPDSHMRTEHSELPNIFSYPELGDLSDRLTSSAYDTDKSLNPAQSSKLFERNNQVDASRSTFALSLQLPPLPQFQHVGSRLFPPISPKPRTRSETSAEFAGKNSALLSPASPSRKYFRLINSPVLSAGKRRVSEPVIDGMTRAGFHQLQFSVTDRRWEKLRSILVSMKNEPFDIDKIVNSTSPELFENLQEKISAQKEQFVLKQELSYLQHTLKQKKYELHQAEAERDSALAYIRHLKSNLTDAGDKNLRLYEQGIESLRSTSVSKENVINMLSPLVKELHEQKSYLDCLMSVVLMRAPWMLDEVDKMELPKDQQFFSRDDDVEGDDFKYEDSDNEVWC